MRALLEYKKSLCAARLKQDLASFGAERSNNTVQIEPVEPLYAPQMADIEGNDNAQMEVLEGHDTAQIAVAEPIYVSPNGARR